MQGIHGITHQRETYIHIICHEATARGIVGKRHCREGMGRMGPDEKAWDGSDMVPCFFSSSFL